MLVDGRPDPIDGLFAFLVALAIAWLLVPLTETAARRLNAIDEPRERSLHEAPTPKLGGLAILCGVLTSYGVHAGSMTPNLNDMAVKGHLPRSEVVPAASLGLERALLAEPALLRAAVNRELGPLLESSRGSVLVDTLEAYLGERENVRAAARRLGIAPRTVAYRLERIERLLGARLDADRRLRLATTLFARRVLGDAERAPGTVTPRRAAAVRPR